MNITIVKKANKILRDPDAALKMRSQFIKQLRSAMRSKRFLPMKEVSRLLNLE